MKKQLARHLSQGSDMREWGRFGEKPEAKGKVMHHRDLNSSKGGFQRGGERLVAPKTHLKSSHFQHGEREKMLNSVKGKGLFSAALVLMFCFGGLGQLFAAQQILVVPTAWPKSEYNGTLNGNIPSEYTQTQIRQYWDGFWGPFWSVSSYGKFKVEITTSDYVFMPWPKDAPVGDEGFITDLTRDAGDAEDFTDDETGENAVHDGFWTPGERYQDVNGDGGQTLMEQWWDTVENPDSESAGKSYDQYGEEFVDWDGDGAFTEGANIWLTDVYDAVRDTGSNTVYAATNIGNDIMNYQEFHFGVPGDGWLGDPNSGNALLASKVVNANELDLNEGDYFSNTYASSPVAYSVGDNLTGDREWNMYTADGTAGASGCLLDGPDDFTVEAKDGVFTPLELNGAPIFSSNAFVTYTRISLDGDVVSIEDVEVTKYRSPERFTDSNGDGVWDDRDPFEDFLIRWEQWVNPGGLAIPPGGWVPVTPDYINNNYPGTIGTMGTTPGSAGGSGILGRYGDGTYQAAEGWDESFSRKMRPSGWVENVELSVNTWDFHGVYGGTGQTAINNWYKGAISHGVDIAGWNGSNFSSNGRWGEGIAWLPWIVTEYDPATGRGGLIDPTAAEFDWSWNTNLPAETTPSAAEIAQMVRWNRFGAILEDGEDPEASGNIYPDANGSMYDSGWEYHDLPSSIYHQGGDLRLGEVTGPQSDSIYGADFGMHDPEAASTFDDKIVIAGPLAYNIYGDNGYDQGSQMAIELLTWDVDGTVAGGPASGKADVNLDGLIDQGFSPPADFANYLYNRGSRTNDGYDFTGEGYPFTRERLLEDVIETLDDSLDYDKFSTTAGLVDYVFMTYGSYSGGEFRFVSGLSHGILTTDQTSSYTVAGQPEPAPLVGVIGAHEMSHDKWGTSDLYDYDTWNGIQESYPVGKFDLMATGGFFKGPISKLQGGYTSTQDLKALLIPNEVQTIEIYPSDYIENENQYFQFSREGKSGESYIFYYDSGVSTYTSNHTGLQIVHIDVGSNNDTFPPQQRTGSHNTYEIVEADGQGSMRDGFSQGGGGSVFPGSSGKTTFNMDEWPRSEWWDGDDSGIEIVDMELPWDPDNPPFSQGDGFDPYDYGLNLQPMKVTFRWKNFFVPNTTFIDPPGGLSIGSSYIVKITARDLHGGSRVYMYWDDDDENYDGTYMSLDDKEVSGDVDMNFNWSVQATDGGYYFYTFVVPGSTDEGTENEEYIHHSLKIGTSGTLSANAGVDAYNILAADNKGWATQQFFTVSCNYAGTDGVATFTVEGSETGMEPELLTAGNMFTTENSFTGGYQFTVMANGTPFGEQDTFRVYTSGLSPYSQAVLATGGQVLAEDANAVEVVSTVISNSVTEGGTSATFSVRLNTKPSADVVVTLESSDATEGVVDLGTLVFTPDIDDEQAYWKLQTVAVTGLDDDESDGDIEFQINLNSTSDDDRYNGLAITPVAVTNRDDEFFGLDILSADRVVSETDDQTTIGSTFDVRLRSLPTQDVIVFLSSTDPGEGIVMDNVMTFTPDNWNSYQTVFMSGNNDDELDGDQDFFVQMDLDSEDNNFNLLTRKLDYISVDDDVASVVISEMSNALYESGISGTFSIRLSREPIDDVFISMNSQIPNSAILDVPGLVFGPDNFSVPQTVTVYPVEDDDATLTNVEIRFDPLVSTSANYNTLQPDSLNVQVVDNDDIGYTVSNISNPIDENGRTATFMVMLQTPPTGIVTIDVQSSDITEGTVNPTVLEFDANNWNGRQLVTVSGVDDSLSDGDADFDIYLTVDTANTSDTQYRSRDPRDVTVRCYDNEKAEIILTVDDRLSSENRGKASFTMLLSQEPDASVTLTHTSSDSTEADFAGGSAVVTFTPENYNIPQTVFITGQGDGLEDGNISYFVQTTVSSTDTDYNDAVFENIYMVNLDSETPAIEVSALSTETTESESTGTYSVKLLKEPEGSVSINLQASDEGEITLSANSLVFRPDNFSSPQEVTITGVDDFEGDGDVPVFVSMLVDEASSSEYRSTYTPNIRSFNVDNDQAGLNIEFDGITTSEDGDKAYFWVSLFQKPTANLVKVEITVNDETEASIDQGVLLFLQSTWSTPQRVTVTGLNDDLVDGDTPFTLSVVVDTVDDAYSKVTVPDLNFTNIDNDSPRVNFFDVSGNALSFSDETVEEGNPTSANLTVSVNLQVEGELVLELTTSDNSEAILTKNEGTDGFDSIQLTFNEANDFADQTFIIQSVDDELNDGDAEVAIQVEVHGDTPDTSDYKFLNFEDIIVTNLDDDKPEVVVSAISGNVSEFDDSTTASANFSVALNSIPASKVTLGFTTSDQSEITIVSATSIDLVNKDPVWIEVAGVNDDIDDGSIESFINVTINSVDTEYSSLDNEQVTVITDDDDDEASFNIDTDVTKVEEGSALTLSANLNTEPTSSVVLTFATSSIQGSTDSRVESIGSLTFTTSNWDDVQTTTIQTIENGISTGAFGVTVTAAATSTDSNYNALADQELDFTINEDDFEAINIGALSGNVSEDGLTATIAVSLGSEMSGEGNLVLEVVSDDSGEVEVLTPYVVFEPENWEVEKLVKIQGVDDELLDGDQRADITFSANSTMSTTNDQNYLFVGSDNIEVINVDTDMPSIVIEEFDNQVDEEGGTSSFMVSLQAEPTSNIDEEVTLNITTSDDMLQVSVTELTFDALSYQSSKIVTVQVSDGVNASTNVDLTISVDPADPAGSNYKNLADTVLTFEVQDLDVPTIKVTPTKTGDGASSDVFVTDEAGEEEVTVEVYLTSQPTGTVTVNIATDDNNEVLISPTSLTFGAGDFDTVQTFTLEGRDDDDLDGDTAYRVTLAAEGGGYGGVSESFNMTNLDDDAPGISVSVASDANYTAEWGTSAMLTLKLASRPANSADVTVAVGTSDADEAEVADTTMITLSSPDFEETFYVDGKDDADADGDQTFFVQFGAAESEDSDYNGLTIDDISLINYDDETSGIRLETLDGTVLTAADNLMVQEWSASRDDDEEVLVPSLSTNTFKVSLLSEPAFGSSVILNVSSADESIATVDTAQLVFDADNLEAEVTIYGVDDPDGDFSTDLQTEIRFEIDDQTNSLSSVALPPRALEVVSMDDDMSLEDNLGNTGVTVSAVIDLIELQEMLMDGDVVANDKVFLDVLEGMGPYTWEWDETSFPTGHEMEVTENGSQLVLDLGSVTGEYKFTVTDSQTIVKEQTSGNIVEGEVGEYTLFLVGEPLITEFERPTPDTFRVFFEADPDIISSRNYTVFYRGAGASDWTPVRNQQTVTNESSTLSKAKSSEDFETFSITFDDEGVFEREFRIEVTDLTGTIEAPSIPEDVLQNNSKSEYSGDLDPMGEVPTRVVIDGSDGIIGVSGGSSGGGGGGGCLLQ